MQFPPLGMQFIVKRHYERLCFKWPNVPLQSDYCQLRNKFFWFVVLNTKYIFTRYVTEVTNTYSDCKNTWLEVSIWTHTVSTVTFLTTHSDLQDVIVESRTSALQDSCLESRLELSDESLTSVPCSSDHIGLSSTFTLTDNCGENCDLEQASKMGRQKP